MNAPTIMGIVIAVGVISAGFLMIHGVDDLAPGASKHPDQVVSDDATEAQSGQSDRQDPETLEQKFANIETYLKNHPSDRRRAYAYGAALIGMGRFQRAEQFFKNQMREFPGDAKVPFGLGCCFEKSGAWNRAIQAYEMAIQLDRGYRDALNRLAWLLATAPDPAVRNGQRAVALARMALGDQHPPDPELMNTLAAGYAEIGQYRAAVKIQQYVVRKGKGDDRDAVHRLELYQRKSPFRVARPIRQASTKQ